MNKIVIIHDDSCNGCSRCVDMCPKKILYIEEGVRKCRVTDENQCDRLGGCEGVCPNKAIRITQN